MTKEAKENELQGEGFNLSISMDVHKVVRLTYISVKIDQDGQRPIAE